MLTTSVLTSPAPVLPLFSTTSTKIRSAPKFLMSEFFTFFKMPLLQDPTELDEPYTLDAVDCRPPPGEAQENSQQVILWNNNCLKAITQF
jgi:hypothetical protein